MPLNTGFPTDVDSILQRIDNLNIVSYGKTRNYINVVFVKGSSSSFSFWKKCKKEITL